MTADDKPPYYDDLFKDIRLGYGPGDVVARVTAEHTSKGHRMPILEATCAGRDVSVAWYGFNFYNYYTAFRFARALPATLLYPLGRLFGPKHHSGHEADCPLPDITNLEKDYWNRRPYEGFACFAGGWHLATTLRYLEAVSKIDQRALFDVAMDKTNHGKVDVIDGNSVNFKALSKVVGIPEVDTYAEQVAVPDNPVIEAIAFDWFGNRTGVGPTSVSVTIKRDAHLPAPTNDGDAYVDPMDTWLATRLDDSVQARWSEETKYKARFSLGFVPTKMFKARAPELTHKAPYHVWPGYHAAFETARIVRFAVPNALDAMLLVLWWLKAGIPCATEMLSHAAANPPVES